ncbi:MAG: hypothetical protein JW738_01780 [Actinobacteria bacterium]|nr:hypothetical protein [Actinomycetota bacterium]
MAERRMLNRRVAFSKKIAWVSWQAEATYYRCFPFTDDAGRMVADPEEFKGTVFPIGKKGKSISTKQIEKILVELHNIGLVILYPISGTWYLQITKFNDFQSFRPDREKVVKCPKPPDDIPVTYHDMTLAPPREVKGSKDKGSKDKGSKAENPQKSSHECGKPKTTKIPDFLQKPTPEDVPDETPAELEAKRQKYLKDFKEGTA